MIVRLNFEGNRQSVADINDSGILFAGPTRMRGDFVGKSLSNGRVFL